MGAVAPGQRLARGWAQLVHETSFMVAEIEAFALPMRCPGCDEVLDASQALCAVGTAAVPRVEGALCVRCLAAGRDAPGCLREPGFLAFPAWIYDERASLAVHALKFQ